MPSLLRPVAIFSWAILFISALFFSRTAQLNSGFNLWMGFLLASAGCLWVAILWRNGWHSQSTPLDGGLTAVVIALTLSAFFSLDPSRSWRMAWNWTACILAFYMAVTFFRTTQTNHQPVIAIYLVILALMSLVVYQSLGRWMLDWYTAFGWELGIPRPPRAANHLSPNILAALLNFGLLLGWGVWQSHKRPWWGWLLLLTFLPLLLLTGSRSGWLGFFVGSLVVGLGHWWHNHQAAITTKDVARLAGVVVGAGLLLLLLLILLRPDTLRLGEGFSILYRGEFWGIAWNMWRERPWLGRGLDTFGSFFLLNNPNTPPATVFRAAHSWWLSLLGETGLMGLGSAAACWVLLGRWLWAHRQPHHWSPTAVALLATLAAFTVHATFDTPEPFIFLIGAIWLGLFITTLNPTPTATPIWRTVWPVAIWGLLLMAGGWAYPALRHYEQGIASAEAGDWQTAAEQFTAAQSRLPYTETSFLLASALTQGRLAAEDPTHLPTAITTYEQLLAYEPGWPSNYANLAALHWQAGDRQTAIALMEQAHSLAPKVEVYLLNLGLWHEAMEDELAATASYQQLAALPHTWATPTFWQATPIRQSAAPTSAPDPAWQALTQQDWATAEAQYTTDLQQNPRNASAHLGLGIRHLLMGNSTAATQSLNRAQLLRHGHAIFWLLAQEDPTAEFLDFFRYHSTFGLGQGGILVYPVTIFNRPSLPHDLLPQLQCLALDESTSQHLALLSTWSAVQNPLLSTLPAPTSQGLVPCAISS